ncbi:hypothetical protein J3R82DRAFT_7388, partial [Butyriboletus roseoflavus]
VYTSQLSEEIPTATKHKQTQYHAKEDHLGLFDTLLTWQNEAHAHNPNHFSQSTTEILDDKELNLLSKIHPSDIISAQNLTNSLQETSEWELDVRQQIFNTIRQFNHAQVKKAINTDTTHLAK